MGTRFSVIVPVYGVEAYLPACVESVLGQTWRDFELILVDDGSPDGCPALCDEYAARDPRIRAVHQANGGLVRARQSGAAAASGEYVCCVDGDDRISERYLERMAEAIDASSADVVCCGIRREGDRRAYRSAWRPGLYDRRRMEEEIFPALIERRDAVYFPPSVCGKAVRRERYVPHQMAVDPGIGIGEDRACMVPCLRESGSVWVLDDALYEYRTNRGSMTKRKRPFSWEGLRRLVEHLRGRIDLDAFDFREQMDRFTEHLFFLTAVSQFYREDPYREIRAEILSEMEDPLYAEAVRRGRFSGSVRGALMERALRGRWTFPMAVYARLR